MNKNIEYNKFIKTLGNEVKKRPYIMSLKYAKTKLKNGRTKKHKHVTKTKTKKN